MKLLNIINNNTNLEVRDTKTGKGLFTLKPIKMGEFVLNCSGKIIYGKEEIDTLKPKYMMQIGLNKYLISNGNNLDDYANHSCNPNMGFITGEPIHYAIRDINCGEELTWNYTTSMYDYPYKLDCKCNNNCLIEVNNFINTPVDLQVLLLPYSLNYIRRIFNNKGR